MLNISQGYHSCVNRVFMYLQSKIQREVSKKTGATPKIFVIEDRITELVNIGGGVDCVYGAIQQLKENGWRIKKSNIDFSKDLVSLEVEY